jgi:hypothetical protein
LGIVLISAAFFILPFFFSLFSLKLNLYGIGTQDIDLKGGTFLRGRFFYVVRDGKKGMWEIGISHVIRYCRKCHLGEEAKKL